VSGSLAALLATSHPTVADAAVFAVGALIILVGALGVVLSRNPVHAALSLVTTLFGVALLFIEQNADFLAAVQIIVYAGAIVVLFLFVIMFLGVDRNENIESEPLKGQRPLAILLIVVASASLIALGVSAHWATGAHQVTYPTAGGYGDVRQIGKSVFTTYLYAFEATAALLVIAVVGAVILARRPPRDAGVADPPEATGAPAGVDGPGATAAPDTAGPATPAPGVVPPVAPPVVTPPEPVAGGTVPEEVAQ